MKQNLAYWIPTGLFALALTASGLMAASGGPEVVAMYGHLGFPAFFTVQLGIAKLLGVVVLLAPGLPRLKEWAYAGFAVNLVSAVVAHVASGDPIGNAIAPVVLLGLALASWWLRPESRKLAGPVV